MKKFIAVVLIAMAVAGALWVAFRIELGRRVAEVPSLLPRTTLLLLQVPDFQEARTQWHKSNLFALWHEPSVQEWLRRPLASLPGDHGERQTLEEFLALKPERGFLALTALANSDPKLIGGFHFQSSNSQARKFIEQRQAELLSKTKTPQRATIPYRQHEIETVKWSNVIVASVYDHHWYFASNDVAVLKELLDRVDHRDERAGSALKDSPDFTETIAHLPHKDVAMAFIEPGPFVEKLLPIVSITGQSLPLEQLRRWQQVKSMAAAFSLDAGEMRETDFVAMPLVGKETKLQRPLLGAAGANTFLYSVSRVHWSENLLASSAPAAVGLPALVQQFSGAMKSRGVSADDLDQAFGQELEVIGDWPANSHWPSLVAALPVRDKARAGKIADALATVEIGGAPWKRSKQDGVDFYEAEPLGGFVPLHPALAVSEKFFLAGSDAGAIQATLAQLAKPADELESSSRFKDAAKRVQTPGSAFNFVDTRLLYERADAALRPLLVMSASLSPGLRKNVDPSKLPPRDAVVKHLTPIVMSQRYEKNGYLTQSVGPVTFRQATVGLAALAGGMFIYLQERIKSGNLLPQSSPPSIPTSTVSPTETPSPSPW